MEGRGYEALDAPSEDDQDDRDGADEGCCCGGSIEALT